MTDEQDIARLLPVLELRVLQADRALADANATLFRIEARIATLRSRPDTAEPDLASAARDAKHREWVRDELARLAGPLAIARATCEARQREAARERARHQAVLSIQDDLCSEKRRTAARDAHEALITRALIG